MQIVQSLLEKMGGLSKLQIKGLTTLLATILVVCGKVNFTNSIRYSPLSEKTYRRRFAYFHNFGFMNPKFMQFCTTISKTVRSIEQDGWVIFLAAYCDGVCHRTIYRIGAIPGKLRDRDQKLEGEALTQSLTGGS
jgi:hypothetical protein